MAIRAETEDLIEFLNELNRVDPDAVASLMRARVPCNEALATHPTVQVGRGAAREPQCYEVGILGVLNGYCGVYGSGVRAGWGPITAIVDEDTGFVERFELTKNEVR